MKKIGDVTVNDGKGLFDNEGICDSLIGDLNTIIKLAVSGQFVQGCAVITGMAQKLLNLKKGIKSDMDSMKEKVEELKRMNDELFEQNTGIPVEKDGAYDGEN